MFGDRQSEIISIQLNSVESGKHNDAVLAACETKLSSCVVVVMHAYVYL